MERLAFTGRRATRPPAAATEGGDAQAIVPAAAATEPERDRLAFRALLGFMLVLLVRPQDQLPFLAPLHLAELLGTLAFVAVIAGRASRGVPLTRTPAQLVAVLAFAAVIVGTVPLSFWPGGSMALFTDQFAKIVVVFVVMTNTLNTRRRLEQLLTVIVTAVTYVAARAVVDYVRGANLVEGGRVAGAVGGLFGNPNDMALNMVAFLPLGIALALDAGRPRARLLAMVGIPAMIGAIIFSQSRGGTLGLLGMMVVIVFYMRRLKPAVATAVIVAGLAALPMLPASFTERMASIFDADQDPSGSREARKTLLREGWNVFLANPLLGIGAGQFTNYNPESREEAWRQTHNSSLQVASELGLVGVVVFGFVIWTGFAAGFFAVREARRAKGQRRARAPGNRRREKPTLKLADAEWLELNAAMIVASMVGWFIAAQFASVAYYWTLYFVLGLAGGMREVALQLGGPVAGVRRRAEVRAA